MAPWIDLAANAVIADSLGRGGKEVPQELRGAIFSQIQTVLEVLQSFGGGSSATYLEDGALVNHGETLLRDSK